VGNRPTAINPRRLKDCDSSLLFRSPKALKVPSRHHVEVRVKPAGELVVILRERLQFGGLNLGDVRIRIRHIQLDAYLHNIIYI